MKLNVNKKINPEIAISESSRQASCSPGVCLLSNPRTIAFVIPFLGALALEQFAAASNSCFSAPLCSMCIVSKTTVAIFAGLIGMALQNFFSKKEPAGE